MSDVTKREVLLKLQDLGWTDLIDNRWRMRLIGDIYDNFPDISIKTLKEVLDLVIIN